MRRAYFDLTGLPPTPEEVRAFPADTKPGAYERLIDRLLASPRYGERWGRQWLDAAGYVDTDGKDFEPVKTGSLPMACGAIATTSSRPTNEDKPWDRFLTEQIAGDELVDWRSAKKFTPEMVELLTATGYMRNILDITEEDISNLPVERYEALFKLVEKVSSSTLGLTVQCARCHTHKFDPIPQRDYYRLLSLSRPPTIRRTGCSRRTGNSVHSFERRAGRDRAAQYGNRSRGRSLEEATHHGPAPLRAAPARTETEGCSPNPSGTMCAPRWTRRRRSRTRSRNIWSRNSARGLKIADADVAKILNEDGQGRRREAGDQIRVWNGYRRKLEKLRRCGMSARLPTIRLLQRGSARIARAEGDAGVS